MIGRLLYKSRIKKYRKVLCSKERTKQFVLPDQVKSCLVLRSTIGDNESLYSELISLYPNIEFTSLWHVNSGSVSPEDCITITKENFTSKGIENADDAVKLLEAPFDWLIDLSNSNSEIVELILLTSNAKCKISWRYLGGFIADITMKDVKNRVEFIQNLKLLFSNLSCNGK